MSRPWALVRAVPASLADALSAEPPDPPIDLAAARAQHAAYVAALLAAGAEVLELPADDACPDCVFIEDTAIVLGDAALATRPGAPSRRAEVSAVAEALGRRLEIETMAEPATLDGGDCLRLGQTIYVGRSARTNAAGIDRLAAFARARGVAVVPVAMPRGVLHLKSVCSPIGDDTVLLAPGTIPPGTFIGARILLVSPTEAHAANAVSIGDAVLGASDGPRAADLVATTGARVIPVDTGELRKADGALTCLSIVVG